MRIAFDSIGILGKGSRNRGIGNYSLNFFVTMIEEFKENKYFFLNLLDDSFSILDHMDSDVDNLTEIVLYFGMDGGLLNDNDLKHVFGELVKKFIHENNIDLFFISSPMDGTTVTYEKDWFDECKTIAIVYDIIPYIMKSHYLSDFNTHKMYMERIDMLKWVDRLQVISQSVKDDLISYLGFKEDRISVIWGGIDKKFRKIKVLDIEKKKLFDKFKIDSDYIICTGGDDERKNIAGLIEAFSRLPREIIKQNQLIIVCKLSTHSFEYYSRFIGERECEGRIVLTGFVSDEELVALYNLAKLTAFPSKYEGFGLPVVESWACDTPVLTSNSSSLVQIAGDAAIIVNPHDIDDISKGLEYALTRCDLNDLKARGRKRLLDFSWKKTANLSYKDICKIGEGKKCDFVSGNNSVKERLAFFSPLPPIESGISDYSVDIIKGLLQYYNIDIFIDDGYEVDIDFDHETRIFNHSEFNKHVYEYKEVIYQVGNSVYHTYMFEYIKKHPGVVVLHDYNMHGIYRAYSVSIKGDYDLYKEFLKEDYPQNVVDSYIGKLRNNECGFFEDKWEVNGIVTNYATKIIVHSLNAKEKLLSHDISRNVKSIWSFIETDIYKDMNKKCLREQKEFNENDIIIAAFGLIHITKRAIQIIKAVGRIINEYDNVKLLFVGRLDDGIKDEFYDTVRNCEIKDKTRVTGYVSIDEFNNYIKMTDICLNLRHPYNGETSATMIRNLAAGNAVIVNDIGSFSEIPDEICIKIPDVASMKEDEEIDHIYRAIIRLIVKPDEVKRIGNLAREFAVENLDISKAAKEYKDYIEAPIYRSVSEETLQIIRDSVANGKDIDLKGLSKTLAWIKEPINTENYIG